MYVFTRRFLEMPIYPIEEINQHFIKRVKTEIRELLEAHDKREDRRASKTAGSIQRS